MTNPLRIDIHSFREYGEPKLKKPKELTRVSQFASVHWGKVCCKCFIKDSDVWVLHRDFFSKPFRPPNDDIGESTSYYLRKYFGVNHSEKFIYADTWGSIVLRNEAWLTIRGALKYDEWQENLPLFHRDEYTHTFEFDATRALSETVGVKWWDMSLEWSRFFEELHQKILQTTNT